MVVWNNGRRHRVHDDAIRMFPSLDGAVMKSRDGAAAAARPLRGNHLAPARAAQPQAAALAHRLLLDAGTLHLDAHLRRKDTGLLIPIIVRADVATTVETASPLMVDPAPDLPTISRRLRSEEDTLAHGARR